MATKRPKRRFNLFDEEFGDPPDAPIPSSKSGIEDAVSRRIRIRQAIVDLPFESKIEFLKSESTDPVDLEELKITFLGNSFAREEERPSVVASIQESNVTIFSSHAAKTESIADAHVEQLSNGDAVERPPGSSIVIATDGLSPTTDHSE